MVAAGLARSAGGLNENRVGFGREATLLADAADAAPDLHDLYEPALDGAFADADLFEAGLG